KCDDGPVRPELFHAIALSGPPLQVGLDLSTKPGMHADHVTTGPSHRCSFFGTLAGVTAAIIPRGTPMVFVLARPPKVHTFACCRLSSPIRGSLADCCAWSVNEVARRRTAAAAPRRATFSTIGLRQAVNPIHADRLSSRPDFGCLPNSNSTDLRVRLRKTAGAIISEGRVRYINSALCSRRAWRLWCPPGPHERAQFC